MTSNDIIKMVKAGSLANIAVSNNQETITMFIYLGLSMLYQRFNMSIKTETIKTNEVTNIYELRNTDLAAVLSLYNDKGIQLKPSSITDGKDYDYKQLSYRTFLFKEPLPAYIMFVYSATPDRVVDIDAELDIPAVMIPVLLDYVAYMGHSTVNTDQNNTANTYFAKFDKACNELDSLGYRVNISTETISLYAKGYR